MHAAPLSANPPDPDHLTHHCPSCCTCPQSLKSPQKPKLGDDDMAAVINDGLELYAQVGAARSWVQGQPILGCFQTPGAPQPLFL